MEINGGIGADEALTILLNGNKRFSSGNAQHPHQSPDWREKIQAGQSPIAVVVSCADSRVPPEIIFDQGLGDLYVIRTSGHVIDQFLVGNIEYAVTTFGIPLILVLGHQKCNEIISAIYDEKPSENVKQIVEHLKLAYQDVKDQDGDEVYNTVLSNIRLMVEKIKTWDPVLSKLVVQGNLKNVGCVYSVKTGQVERIL